MNRRRVMIAVACVAGVAACPIAFAEHPIPEPERWATITHAGNAPHVFEGFPGGPVFSLGQVDYEYQIGRTEVTGSEWFEFVQAYAPFVDPRYADGRFFTSRSITLIGPQTYWLSPLFENRPVEVGWHFAARYANWLHNGKALTREAFESGAYDTSTFAAEGDLATDDQLTRSPGARYWIPSQDEWVKASHFDPDKNGPGMPGYWLYPTSSDTQPIGGPPELGGQTSAYATAYWDEHLFPEIAAYQDVQSPWGLWDASGGLREWTETPSHLFFPPSGATRITEGSGWRDGSLTGGLLDQIDSWNETIPSSIVGLRIARAVPGAGSTWAFVCAFSFALKRRRQNDESAGGTGSRMTHRRATDYRLR